MGEILGFGLPVRFGRGEKKNGIFLGSFGPDSDPLQGDWFARKMMMSDVVSIVLRLSIQLCLAAAGDPRGLPALR